MLVAELDLQEPLSRDDGVVYSALMASPTETAFGKLKDRVAALESQSVSPNPCVNRHATIAWIITTTLALLAIFATGYFGILPHLEEDAKLRIADQVHEGLRDPLSRIDGMAEDIAQIKGELSVLLPTINDRVRKQISDGSHLSEDAFKAQLPELNTDLRVAANLQIPLDLSVLMQIRDKLFQATSNLSNGNGEAWNTFVALMSYRSVLTAKADPKYNSYVPRGPAPELSRNIPQIITTHYANNIYVRAIVQLDGASWEGDIFKDSVIRYNGGPLKLRDVRFVNCRFEVPISIPAQGLGKEILASNTVSFDSAG
jgi:hypothetical protein